MTSQREEFKLASMAFSLMTLQEQGIVLTLFKHNKNEVIEAFVDSVHKVVKPLLKPEVPRESEIP